MLDSQTLRHSCDSSGYVLQCPGNFLNTISYYMHRSEKRHEPIKYFYIIFVMGAHQKAWIGISAVRPNRVRYQQISVILDKYDYNFLFVF